MKAIFKKELKGFFTTPIGYVYLAFFQVLSSFFIIQTTENLHSPNMTTPFFFLIFVSILLIPILTMKSFAAEKRNNTDQLLLTSPTSPKEIVLGKFFANFTIFAISTALTLIFLFIMFAFGKPSLTLTLSQYIGFFLLGSALISIGMWCSSFTENQIIAAVISFTAFILLFFIDCVNITNSILLKIVDFVSIIKRYETFNLGILNFSNIIYLLSITGIFLFLSIRALKFQSQPISIPKVILVVLSFICLIILSDTATSKFDLKADLTQDKLYTLSSQTKSLLTYINENPTIDSEITLYELIVDGHSNTFVHNFLEKYAKLKKIKHESINLADNPEFKEKYIGKKELNSGSVIVKYKEKFKVLDFRSFSEEYTNQITMEQKITSAIDYVTKNNENFVVFTTGHQETYDKFQMLNEVLDSENYSILPLNLNNDDIKDDNINLAMIIDPSYDFSDSEIEKLDNFTEKGNNIILMLGPSTAKFPNLSKFIQKWGISCSLPEIVEEKSKNMYGDVIVGSSRLQALMPKIEFHEITSGLNNAYVNLIQPVSLSITEKDEIYSQGLLTTSDMSILRNIKEGTEIPNSIKSHYLAVFSSKKITNEERPLSQAQNKTDGNKPTESDPSFGNHPNPIMSEIDDAIEASKIVTADADVSKNEELPIENLENEQQTPPPEPIQSKIIVYGSPSILLDLMGNRKLVINSLNFMSEKKDSVIIEGKQISTSDMVINENLKNSIKIITEIGIPGLILLTGYIIRAKRRTA